MHHQTHSNPHRRQWIASAASLAIGLCALPGRAFAGDDKWPAHSIRLVVPFSAGAFTDIASRVLAEFASRDLGQAVVVDNRAGAAGLIGTQIVAKAPADGYTLLIGTISTLSMNPGLYKKLPYDVERDFVPVAGLAIGQLVLVARSSLKVKTVGDLIALAKASPGKLTYGSGGSGTTSHLYAEWFKSLAGIQMLHVPFKSQTQAIQGLLGDQVDVLFDTVPTAKPHIQSGKVIPLGLGSLKRSPELAGVPTIAETLPGFDIDTWAVLYAPRGTPPEVLDRLGVMMRHVLAQAPLKEKLAQIGMEPLIMNTPADLDRFVQAQTKRWTRVIEQAGITVEQ
jgi:tripartite-type tricarboxylate transporter receptor subunit TctC